MMQAKHAGMHGNPESGNHPNHSPNKVPVRGEGPANRVDVGPTGTPRENQTPPPRPTKVAHPNLHTKDSLTCVEQS